MDETLKTDQSENDGLGVLLPHEVVLLRHFRRSNSSDQHSIAEYAAECAQGWPAYPTAGDYKPEPDDGLIHLQDCSFDFEDYFKRHKAKQLEEGESEEFKARIYGMFCRDVFRSGGDMRRVSFWAANYVAERLYDALGGVPWEDIMGLPWDEPTPFLTPKGERAVSIYADIENALRVDPSANVTTLIGRLAEKHCVSYETARADYYTWKKILSAGTGIPRKFLNNSMED